jgi:hypothetical protein
MCDYSIRHVASRPAKVGDKVVTATFGGPLNRGFACVAEPNVAVCLMPGTEVALEKVPECDHLLGWLFPALRSRTAGGHKVARFTQVNADQADVHHDALEFPNGKTLLVASLRAGQYATVLQLPASQSPASASAAQRVPEPVTG